MGFKIASRAVALRSRKRPIRRGFAAVIPLLLGGLLALLSGCAATIPPPHPTTVDESRARARWPATSLARLEQGRSLYVERCAACHILYAPSAHSSAEWPELLGEMAEKAHLDPTEHDAVLQYLVTMSEASETTAAAASAAPPAAAP
jgi:hypothetical protein